MSENNENYCLNTWLTRHGFQLVIYLILGGIAYGQVTSELDEVAQNKKGIKEVQKQVNEVAEKVNTQAVTVGKIDERTKNIENSVDDLKRSIERIESAIIRPPR